MFNDVPGITCPDHKREACWTIRLYSERCAKMVFRCVDYQCKNEVVCYLGDMFSQDDIDYAIEHGRDKWKYFIEGDKGVDKPTL